MSKLINNEGATKATLNILANLKEAEDLKIKKRVLSEGYGKTTVVESEDCEDKKEVKEEVDPNAESTDSTLEECPIAGDGNVPEGAIDPVNPQPIDEQLSGVDFALYGEVKEMTEEESALDKSMNALDQIDALAGGDEKLAKMGREMGLEEFKKYLKDNGLMKEESEEVEDKDEDKVEERVCEGLEIVNIKGNTVLLKESNGYIVGKNYDKETGLIESAEEYKTEKVATKAFKRLSEKA